MWAACLDWRWESVGRRQCTKSGVAENDENNWQKFLYDHSVQILQGTPLLRHTQRWKQRTPRFQKGINSKNTEGPTGSGTHPGFGQRSPTQDFIALSEELLKFTRKAQKCTFCPKGAQFTHNFQSSVWWRGCWRRWRPNGATEHNVNVATTCCQKRPRTCRSAGSSRCLLDTAQWYR